MKTKVLLLAALSSGMAYVHAAELQKSLSATNPMEDSMTAEQLQKQLEEADRRKAELAAQLEAKKAKQEAEEARLKQLQQALADKKETKQNYVAVGKAALALVQNLEEEKEQARKELEKTVLEERKTVSTVEEQLTQAEDEKKKAQAAVAAEQQRLKQLELDHQEAAEAVRAAQTRLKEAATAKKAAAQTVQQVKRDQEETELLFQRVSNKRDAAQKRFELVQQNGALQIDAFKELQNRALAEKKAAQEAFEKLAAERKELKKQLPSSTKITVRKGWLWNTTEVAPAEPDSDDEEFEAASAPATYDAQKTMQELRKKIEPQLESTTALADNQRTYSEVAQRKPKKQ